MRHLTSHAALFPAAPPWLEFQPRADLACCTCAVELVSRWYARSSCPLCRGAGVVAPRPVLTAHELTTPVCCAAMGAP